MQSVWGWEPRGRDEEKLFIVGDIWVRVWLPSLPLRKYPAGRCQHPSGSKEKEHHHVEDVFRNSSRPYRRRAEGSAFPLVWEQKICSARGKSTTPLLLLLQGRGKSSRGTGREPAVWTARKHAPSYVHQLKHERSFKQMVVFFKQIFFLNPEVLCNVWEKNFLKIAQRNGLCKVHFWSRENPIEHLPATEHFSQLQTQGKQTLRSVQCSPLRGVLIPPLSHPDITKDCCWFLFLLINGLLCSSYTIIGEL